MVKRATNQELKTWFRKLNRKYHDDQIREPDIIAFIDLSRENSDGMAGQRADGKYFLYIDHGLKRYPDLALIVVHHEMAHLKFPKGIKPHGYQFQSEIIRLWNMGAYEDLL